MLKIALIIAKQDFRDEEYFIPKSIFEAEEIEVKTVSSETGEALGSYGGTTNIDLSLEDLNIDIFDAIIFIGGAGASSYIEDEQCHQIAKDTVSQNKILGAICIAPTILARSGVLKNKKATVWSKNLDKSAVKILKQEGVDYQQQDVVVDENIVTANGPKASRKFGEIIVRILKEL